ncbi:MAG: DNA mismatch endonuclease Vsr [Atribacterota bacterium]|nr:DNA mismatch endonuclease Vsr [Atribacterota bacterium]
MVDHITKEKRSWNMRQIKSRDTKPEILVRSILHSLGYRFRIHKKNLPGNPDIVLPKHKTVIFVNGCFWHQHPNCNRANIPKTNEGYWHPKLIKNIERDRIAHKALSDLGWNVVIIWECMLKDREKLIDFILRNLSKDCIVQ